MNRTIEAALTHSPKHKNTLAAAIMHLGTRDITRSGEIVAHKCQELGITDFPNPFPHGTDDAKKWTAGFNGGDGADEEPAVVAEPEPPIIEEPPVAPEPEPPVVEEPPVAPEAEPPVAEEKAKSNGHDWSAMKSKGDIAKVLNEEFGQELTDKDVKGITRKDLEAMAAKMSNA